MDDVRDEAEVLAVHQYTNKWGVVTLSSPERGHRETPCGPCPWLVDAPVGFFPPEVFKHSARTAYDLATHVFGCHTSSREKPLTCAGFLLRGADHNLSVRMRGPGVDAVYSDRPLYANYRAMAIANGVAPNDPDLARCRD